MSLRSSTLWLLSVILLTASVLGLASSAPAASPVSHEVYPLQPGEQLLDAIPRPRGGTYLVVGRQAQRTIEVPIALPGPGDFNLFPTLNFGGTNTTTTTFSAFSFVIRPTAIVRLGLDNDEVSRIPLDASPWVSFRQALVDADGSLIVLLNTSMPGLPLVNPLFPLEIPPMPEPPATTLPVSYGYLLKTNAAGTRIDRSTLIGGAGPALSASSIAMGTEITDITQDGAGNLYLTGSTSHPDFPVSPTAAKVNPRFDLEGKGAEGFLMKLSRNLDRLIYSTFLGSDEILPYDCTGLGPPVQPRSHFSRGYAVKVNQQQQAIVYASTNGKPLPVTAGAFQAPDTPGSPSCQNPPPVLNNPFRNQLGISLLRFSADGGTLLASAYLGRSALTGLANASGDALQLQAGGTVMAALDEALTNPGAALRLVRLDASLSTVLLQHDLATNGYPILCRTLTVQPDGSLWLSGTLWPSTARVPLGSQQQPSNPVDRIGSVPFTVRLGSDLLLRLSANNLQPEAAYLMPVGTSTAGIRTTAAGVQLHSASGGRISIPASGSVSPAVLGTANAAGLSVKTTVSPYEFLSLYGEGIGPATGVGAAFNAQGDLPTLLGGVRVWIDGVAAPLLYTGNGQINLIAPAQLADRAPGSRVLLEVERDGAIVATVPLRATDWDIHPFRHTSQERIGDVIVLNQDGTLNSTLNPAARGEAVTLFLNGGGAPLDRCPAGRRIASARPFSTLAPRIESARDYFLPVPDNSLMVPWPVEYFGAAPTLAAGTLQLNLRVPQELAFPSHPIEFDMAEASLQFTAPDADPEEEPITPPIRVNVWLNP
ncbi:MAG: hypothetical protein KIT83_12100 [Bryobacterales bacterium]|nr:hypothetical protein [Bryobacterales bacterium]